MLFQARAPGPIGLAMSKWAWRLETPHSLGLHLEMSILTVSLRFIAEKGILIGSSYDYGGRVGTSDEGICDHSTCPKASHIDVIKFTDASALAVT